MIEKPNALWYNIILFLYVNLTIIWKKTVTTQYVYRISLFHATNSYVED